MRILRLLLLGIPALPLLMGADGQGCTPAGAPPDAIADAGAPDAPAFSDVPRPIVPDEPVPPPVTQALQHDLAALCDASHQAGASGPTAVCSPQVPCPNNVTAGTTPPSCPAGTVLVAWQDSVVDPSNVDASGVPHPDARYACAPPEAPEANLEPVPLVVYFTPSFTSADVIYGATSLDDKAPSWAWSYPTSSGLPATGYVLVVAQERNLQLGALGPGMHEDTGYRPADPALNPDVRNADALIDWAVAHYGARIDRSRIYVSGWSNGAIFGQLYAIARHPSTRLALPGSRWGQPTPGGNYVAAAAVYSGDDPFVGFPSGDCGTRTYPTTRAPIYLSHRACDLVPCNESQQECELGYASQTFPATTGASSDATVEFWLEHELTATSGFHAMGDPDVVDAIIDLWGTHLPPGEGSCEPSHGGPNDGSACATYASWIPTPTSDPTPDAVSSVSATWWSGCSPDMQTLQHVLWPGGDEPGMLQFLAGYTAAPAGG